MGRLARLSSVPKQRVGRRPATHPEQADRQTRHTQTRLPSRPPLPIAPRGPNTPLGTLVLISIDITLPPFPAHCTVPISPSAHLSFYSPVQTSCIPQSLIVFLWEWPRWLATLGIRYSSIEIVIQNIRPMSHRLLWNIAECHSEEFKQVDEATWPLSAVAVIFLKCPFLLAPCWLHWVAVGARSDPTLPHPDPLLAPQLRSLVCLAYSPKLDFLVSQFTESLQTYQLNAFGLTWISIMSQVPLSSLRCDVRDCLRKPQYYKVYVLSCAFIFLAFQCHEHYFCNMGHDPL